MIADITPTYMLLYLNLQFLRLFEGSTGSGIMKLLL